MLYAMVNLDFFHALLLDSFVYQSINSQFDICTVCLFQKMLQSKHLDASDTFFTDELVLFSVPIAFQVNLTSKHKWCFISSTEKVAITEYLVMRTNTNSGLKQFLEL